MSERVESYYYVSMREQAGIDVRRHLLRAKQAFSDGRNDIAYDRMRKAANASKWVKFWRNWPSLAERTFEALYGDAYRQASASIQAALYADVMGTAN